MATSGRWASQFPKRGLPVHPIGFESETIQYARFCFESLELQLCVRREQDESRHSAL
jgi:hypothetical protein